MRVLVISSLFPPRERGGYELTCAAFVRYLRRSGNEVRVLTSDHPPIRQSGPDEEWADVHQALRWHDGAHRLGRLQAVVSDRHDLSVLRRHVEDFRPHVVTV